MFSMCGTLSEEVLVFFMQTALFAYPNNESIESLKIELERLEQEQAQKHQSEMKCSFAVSHKSDFQSYSPTGVRLCEEWESGRFLKKNLSSYVLVRNVTKQEENKLYLQAKHSLPQTTDTAMDIRRYIAEVWNSNKGLCTLVVHL